MLSGDKGLWYHLLQPRDCISCKKHLQRHPLGTSLVIQWLRLSAFNAMGAGLIPGCSDLLAMQETLLQFLGQEDPLEKQ